MAAAPVSPPRGKPAAKGGSGLSKRLGPLPVWGWAVAGVVLLFVAYRLYEARQSSAANATAGGLTSPDDSLSSPSGDTGASGSGSGGGGGDLAGQDFESLLQYFESQDQQSSQTIGQIVAGEQGLEASQQALIGELSANVTATSQNLTEQLGTVASSAVGGLAAAATARPAASAPAAAPVPAATPAPDTEPNPGTQAPGPAISAGPVFIPTDEAGAVARAAAAAADPAALARDAGILAQVGVSVPAQPPILAAAGAKKTGTNPKVSKTLH